MNNKVADDITGKFPFIPTELLVNTDLNQLNYLAAWLAKINNSEIEKLKAIMQSPFRFSSAEQLIDYTYNTDYFLFCAGITNTAALARYYIYDTGLCQMPEEWKGGIDLEKFGKHAVEQEKGAFTDNGYLMPSGDVWENRTSTNGISDKYRIQEQD